MFIRQIALVARDMDAVVSELCEALGVEVCFNDTGVAEFGLQNALMAIGNTFLEVVSPTREGTTAGRLLERRHGDGGYMVLLQTQQLAADKQRMEQLGVRLVWQVDLDDIAAVHLHPKDIGGAIVSFDQPTDPASWRWAGPNWQQLRGAGLVDRIVAAEIQAESPRIMAGRWAEVLDASASELGDGVHRVQLDEGEMRFVSLRDGRGEGLSGFDVRATGASVGRVLEVCGVRIRFVA